MDAKLVELNQINTQISFRKACVSLGFEEFPIKGGWDYSKEEANIFDKDDPIVLKGAAFNGIELEYTIADLRINLEFYTLQNEDHKYKDIHWKVLQQEIIKDNDRLFDKITMQISALPFEAYISRKREWKENGRNPDFNKV